MSYQKHKSEESVEDYLEAILILSKKLSFVRSIDIATHLSYSKPSVSVAMKNLKNNGYITIENNGHIVLTQKGLQTAQNTYEKHSLLKKWLMDLGVSEEIATADACKIEHDLSPESFEAIKKHLT